MTDIIVGMIFSAVISTVFVAILDAMLENIDDDTSRT